MIRALGMSVRLHFRWLLGAFYRESWRLTGLGPRRLVILLLFIPVFLMLQALHWLCLGLDNLLFPGFRKQQVRSPLFVTGIPRSGTTFVHRVLAADHEQFTTMRTWEVILAPSILQKKLLRGLAAIDRLAGSPLRRLAEYLTRRMTGDFNDIHSVGLWSAEEDYLALLPVAGCFIMVLAFPGSPSLWQLGRFQEMPASRREILLQFYKGILQRHLHATGNGRRLLSKNAAFGSWIPDLRRTFPDARYLVCVREPRPALRSLISSLRPGMRLFGSEAAADFFAREFQTVLAHAFRIIGEEKRSFLQDHLAILDQKELRDDTVNILQQRLRQVAVTLTPVLVQSILREAAATPKSSPHQHEPLPISAGPREFETMMQAVYEDILNDPFLQRPTHS